MTQTRFAQGDTRSKMERRLVVAKDNRNVIHSRGSRHRSRVSIPCCESRSGCLSRPLDVVPSLTWYLLARNGFGLLALDDIVRALCFTVVNFSPEIR